MFDSTATTQTVTGLSNGTSYTFTVAATNAVGTGPQSAASNAVTPAPVPGAPAIGTVTAGNAKARVAWTAPAANGGSRVTGYVVTPYIGSVAQTPVTFTTASTVQSVTGLANGTTYRFRVAAINTIGTGAQSAAVQRSDARPRCRVRRPSARSTAGNAKARVAWTAPASNGGSPITGYVVTPYIGAVAQAPITFTHRVHRPGGHRA